MTEQDVTDFKSATSSDTKKYAQYFHAMLQRGIYLAPAQYEAMFFSIMHSEKELEHTIKSNFEALEQIYTAMPA
jgi:glutamate-1-semialdehyde 2,1-aminomutase